MSRWQYFTSVPQLADPLDPERAIIGRKDQDGPAFNCQTLGVSCLWEEDSDRLMRYHLLGSNDEDLTDITEVQAATLIDKAVRAKRFRHYPDEPDRGLAQ